MEAQDWVNLIGVVISPIAAVLISIFIQDRKEMRQRKFQIFLTLISTRHNVANEDQVRAYNSIDILFHDSQSVRKNWRDYLELLSQKNRMVEWEIKKLELLKSMAIELGYSKSVDPLDLYRTYGPEGLAKQQQTQAELTQELLNFLRASNRGISESSASQVTVTTQTERTTISPSDMVYKSPNDD